MKLFHVHVSVRESRRIHPVIILTLFGQRASHHVRQLDYAQWMLEEYPRTRVVNIPAISTLASRRGVNQLVFSSVEFAWGMSAQRAMPMRKLPSG